MAASRARRGKGEEYRRVFWEVLEFSVFREGDASGRGSLMSRLKMMHRGWDSGRKRKEKWSAGKRKEGRKEVKVM